jgi:hypothetical protein
MVIAHPSGELRADRLLSTVSIERMLLPPASPFAELLLDLWNDIIQKPQH